MQSLLLALIAVAAVLGVARGCQLHPVFVGDCCKIDYEELSNPAAAEKCHQKHFSNKPSPDQMENANACSYECFFTEQGFLTPDRKLDMAAIMANTSTLKSDLDRQLLEASDRKCFESYQADVDPRLECKSGAMEFTRCVNRAVFLDCPGSQWSGTQECEAIRAEVAGCPQAYVLMGQWNPQ